MESRRDLTVLPMILKGFDLMKPNDLMPVLDHEVEIVIGEPYNQMFCWKQLTILEMSMKEDQPLPSVYKTFLTAHKWNEKDCL